MAKKKINTEQVTTANPLNVEGTYLPSVVAQILKEYYEAFLKAGFNSQQAYELTRDILRFYLLS